VVWKLELREKIKTPDSLGRETIYQGKKEGKKGGGNVRLEINTGRSIQLVRGKSIAEQSGEIGWVMLKSRNDTVLPNEAGPRNSLKNPRQY